MLDWVRPNFYRPWLLTDIKKFCCICTTCQREVAQSAEDVRALPYKQQIHNPSTQFRQGQLVLLQSLNNNDASYRHLFVGRPGCKGMRIVPVARLKPYSSERAESTSYRESDDSVFSRTSKSSIDVAKLLTVKPQMPV